MRPRGVGGRALAAVLVLCASATGAMLLALRQLLDRLSTAIGPSAGDPFFTLYLLEWGADAWRHGLAGFWDAPFFYPAKGVITLSDHGLLLSLLHLGLKLLGAGAPLAHNLLFVASFPLTAVAVYLLLRRATRAPRWSSVALALAVTFAPYRWAQLVHLFMLWAPGPPLAVWAFDRLLARPKTGRALAFVAAYASALLAGCYLAYLLHFALLAVLVVRASRRRERFKLARHWRPLLWAAAAAGVLALAVFWPYIHARSDLKERRRPQEIRAFDASLTDWIAPSRSNLYSGLAADRGRRAERDLFPGLLLSMAALAGLVFWRARGRGVAPATLLARALLVAAVYFALITNADVYLALSRFIPGLDGMRVTTRGQLFVLIGLAVLAARGLAVGAGLLKTRVALRLMPFLVAALLLPDMVARPLRPATFFAPESGANLPPHVRWLDRDDVRAIAVLPIRGDGRESRRMLRWRWSGKPIANGYSSFLPPTFRYLHRECRPKDNRLSLRCVAALRKLGISHVVAEDAWYAAPGAPLAARLAAAVAGESAGEVQLVFSDSEALVFSVDASAAPAVAASAAAEKEEK